MHCFGVVEFRKLRSFVTNAEACTFSLNPGVDGRLDFFMLFRVVDGSPEFRERHALALDLFQQIMLIMHKCKQL